MERFQSHLYSTGTALADCVVSDENVFPNDGALGCLCFVELAQLNGAYGLSVACTNFILQFPGGRALLLRLRETYVSMLLPPFSFPQSAGRRSQSSRFARRPATSLTLSSPA